MDITIHLSPFTQGVLTGVVILAGLVLLYRVYDEWIKRTFK